MKYSVGDRVKIIEDGWGCGLQHVGMCGVVESVPTPPYKNYTLRMDDGSTLYEMWEQGFSYADAERDYKPAKMTIDDPIPHDWQHPDWEARTKVHDWKNYVETTALEDMWNTFDDNQKKVLAYNFQLIADDEDWD